MQVGFLGFLGGGVQHVGFGRGLVLAHLEQVYVHAQLVLQAFTVVLAVAAQALQHQAAHRIEVNLVGLRGQQVLGLAEVLAEGDDLLAGRAELRQRGGDFAQRGVAGGLQLVHAQQHALDLLVLLRRLDGAQQVAQLHFLGALVAQRLGQRAGGGIGGELLHQAAFRRQHEGGALHQRLHPATAGGDDEEDEDQEQQPEEDQVEDQLAGEIRHVPQADEEGGDRAATGCGGDLAHGELRETGTTVACGHRAFMPRWSPVRLT